MTEKRFTLSEDKYDETIFDNGIAMGIIDVVEKLNEQYEENEQLKSDLDYFQRTYEIEERGLDIVAPMCTIGSPTPSRLELFKENELLKQQHRELQIEFNDACGIIHDLRESKLDLEDENEQLKQSLDYADDLIQSHLSEHFIRQWRNFKTGHKEYNDFWEEKLKTHKELKEDVE